MGIILRTPTSLRDISDSVLYIARENPDAARKLETAIDQTLNLLADFPDLGTKRNEFGPLLRSFPVRKFKNYIAFYRPIPGGIELLRMLHGARDLPTLFRGR
jgi:toxin ParE1/3/4